MVWVCGEEGELSFVCAIHEVGKCGEAFADFSDLLGEEVSDWSVSVANGKSAGCSCAVTADGWWTVVAADKVPKYAGVGEAFLDLVEFELLLGGFSALGSHNGVLRRVLFKAFPKITTIE